MRALLVCALILGMSLPSLAAGSRQIMAQWVSHGPVIDGRLTDPAWAGAAESGGFTLIDTGKRPEAATFVKALTDGKSLFVAFRCVEPKIAGLKAETRPPDGEPWLDDSVEVIIDPTNDRLKVFHLIANAAGSRYDAQCTVKGPESVGEDPHWTGSWEYAVSRGNGEWYAEWRIPFSDMGIQPETNPCIGVNFARARFPGKEELSNWSPSRDLFTNPSMLGQMALPSSDGICCEVAPPDMQTAFAGDQTLDFKVTNRSRSGIEVRYVYRLTGVKESSGQSDPATILPGKTAKMALPISVEPGDHRFSFSVEDVRTGKPFYTMGRELDALPQLQLQESLYALYQNKAEANVYVNVLPAKLKGLRLLVSLLREGSNAPVAQQPFAPPFDRPVHVSFPLKTAGTYRLRAELMRGSDSVGVQESGAMPYPQRGVTFDKDGFLTVDGKPYFPVGLYTLQSRTGDHDTVLEEARQAGFNTTVFYATTTESLMPLLDAANRHGIKAFVYPTTPFSLRTGNETTETITKDVQDKMHHPAILGWYLVDEPEGIGKANTQGTFELYQLIKNLDPGHPCSLVVMSAKAAGDFKDAADVIWTDPYPIPSRPASAVADQTAGCAKAIGDKPLWVVPQAFDWSVWNTGKIGKVHRPTPEEERCMTYLALVHGAKGIIYWAHTASKYYIEDYPEHWAAMKKIAGELSSLSPVLLTPDAKLKVTVTGGNIDWMVKKRDGSTYLFAVNRDPRACAASFALPKNSSPNAEVLFEGRSVAIEGDTLKDDFKPLEVHVYKLAGR